MRKIIVNLSMLGKKPTGLGVYSNSCANILSKSNFHLYILGSEDYRRFGEILFKTPNFLQIGGGFVKSILRQLYYFFYKFNSNCILYSPTHHGFFRVNNQIITIHDLICFRHPFQHIYQYIYFKFLIPLLLRRCIAVFTVSNATKCDIIKFYKYPSDKIYIIPNSIDASAFNLPSVSAIDIPVDKPFLLMVGAKFSHKNVQEVLRFHALWSRDYYLIVCSASGKYLEYLKGLVSDYKIESSVLFFDYVDADTLNFLYSHASALVYPSQWEGFGIPPLEAIASNIPVIASDIAPHREVLCDAAFFVTLNSLSSWETAFLNIKNEGLVRELKSKYQSVLNRYSQANQQFHLIDALNRVDDMNSK